MQNFSLALVIYFKVFYYIVEVWFWKSVCWLGFLVLYQSRLPVMEVILSCRICVL